jgi:hypothetical protein
MSLHCYCLGDNRRVLKDSWSFLSGKVKSALLEAECKLDALSSIDLGGQAAPCLWGGLAVDRAL